MFIPFTLNHNIYIYILPMPIIHNSPVCTASTNFTSYHLRFVDISHTELLPFEEQHMLKKNRSFTCLFTADISRRDIDLNWSSLGFWVISVSTSHVISPVCLFLPKLFQRFNMAATFCDPYTGYVNKQSTLKPVGEWQKYMADKLAILTSLSYK